MLTVLLLVFLYDPNGAAAGPGLIGESSILSGVAWLLGYVLWLLGIAFWFAAVSLLVALVNPLWRNAVCSLLMEKNMERYGTPDWIGQRPGMGIYVSFEASVAVIGMLSGFWFTASALFTLELVWLASRVQFRKIIKKRLEQAVTS